MRAKCLVVAATLVLVAGGHADAEVITFDTVLPTENICTSVSCQGFHFGSQHFHTYGVGRNWDGIAYNGSTHIGYESVRGLPITMTRLDGAVFSLFSLDVSEFYAAQSIGAIDRPNAELLSITGTTRYGTNVGYSLFLDGLVDGPGGVTDFEHFLLPSIFSELTSVTFTGLRLDGSSGGVAIDNIEYATAPEPGTLMIFGVGLIGFATMLRQRTRS